LTRLICIATLSREKNLLKRFFDLIKNFFNSNKVKKETNKKKIMKKKTDDIYPLW